MGNKFPFDVTAKRMMETPPPLYHPCRSPWRVLMAFWILLFPRACVTLIHRNGDLTNSILGDPGVVSRVGRNGGTKVSALLENFRRTFSPDPTDCPWVSEDGPIRAQPISYPESSGLLVGGITLPKKTEYDPKMTRRRPEDSTGPKTDPVDTGYEIASSEERHTFWWIWLPSFCDLLGKNHVRA